MKNDGYVLVSDLLKLSKKTAAGNPLFTHTEADVCKVILTLVLTNICKVLCILKSQVNGCSSMNLATILLLITSRML